MITGCEAHALSDFILSQYRERAALRSYTGRALSECCSLLAELVSELELSPVAFISTSRSHECKHLFHCCQPVLERALQSVILSHEPIPKAFERSVELRLDSSDALSGEWFLIAYSPELAYLVLVQASPDLDLNNISVLISFDQ